MSLLALHRRNNRESAELWARFGEHRRRVTALAAQTAAAPGSGRLLVLGAGNCNDLELEALASVFGEIHLVDLDAEALGRARDRQPLAVQDKLRLQAPVDLSGAFPDLPRWGKTPATPAELAVLPSQATQRVLAVLPGGFEVVLSTCFLSQLMQSVFAALGPRHPQLQLIACALAVAHLRSVVGLLTPGGRAHLVTDAVSTETYPLQELWQDKDPLEILAQAERANNVFSGTGLSFLRRILATDATVAPLLEGKPVVVPPWLWTFSEERTYLVYALSFVRAFTSETIPR